MAKTNYRPPEMHWKPIDFEDIVENKWDASFVEGIRIQAVWDAFNSNFEPIYFAIDYQNNEYFEDRLDVSQLYIYRKPDRRPIDLIMTLSDPMLLSAWLYGCVQGANNIFDEVPMCFRTERRKQITDKTDYFEKIIIPNEDTNIPEKIKQLINHDIREYKKRSIEENEGSVIKATGQYNVRKFLNEYSNAINLFGLHSEYNCKNIFNKFIEDNLGLLNPAQSECKYLFGELGCKRPRDVKKSTIET